MLSSPVSSELRRAATVYSTTLAQPRLALDSHRRRASRPIRKLTQKDRRFQPPDNIPRARASARLAPRDPGLCRHHCFLVLIGTNLVAEGLGVHIPKGYTYFAIGFSVLVELLNIRLRAKAAPVHLKGTGVHV